MKLSWPVKYELRGKDTGKPRKLEGYSANWRNPMFLCRHEGYMPSKSIKCEQVQVRKVSLSTGSEQVVRLLVSKIPAIVSQGPRE